MSKNTTATQPTEITYHCNGDYLIPDIGISEKEAKLPPLGVWGRMRLDYLKNHRRTLYTDLKLSGELYAHCYETEQCANNRKDFMMRQAIAKIPYRRI